MRTQLIRRPRGRRAVPPLRVFAGWTGGATPWLEGREVPDPAELAGLDLAGLAAGRRPGLAPLWPDPLLLVCTLGRRNTCCARYGGPLARALDARFGDTVWETGHVGGDRYAPNLVLLPHAVYYGALTPDRAVQAAGAYLRGEVTLEGYRGRAGREEAAQAVEHLVRRRTGRLGLADVAVESVADEGARARAVVRLAGARFAATVERRVERRVEPKTPVPSGDSAGVPPCTGGIITYRLVDLDPSPVARVAVARRSGTFDPAP